MSNSENQTTSTKNAALDNNHHKEGLIDSIISLMRDDADLANEVYMKAKGLLHGKEQDVNQLKPIDQLAQIVEGMKKEDGHVLIVATCGAQSVAMVKGNRIEIGSTICTEMEQDKDFAAILESSVMVHNMLGAGQSRQPDPMDIFQGMGGLKRDPLVEFLATMRNSILGSDPFASAIINNTYPEDPMDNRRGLFDDIARNSKP